MNDYRIDAARGYVIGKRGRPIRGRSGGRGYVHVRTHGGAYIGMAHRMIWESVHGPIPDGMQINHKNGIKHDNRICNLEVVTPSENTKHAYATGLARADGPFNGRAIGKSRRAP